MADFSVSYNVYLSKMDARLLREVVRASLAASSEWENYAAREIFLASELFSKLEEVLVPRFLKRDLIWPIGDCLQIVRANPAFPPQKLYEILTVYFPADLDDTTVLSLEKCYGMIHWHAEPDWDSPEEPPHPMVGFLSQKRAWMNGKIEYRGQAARRLVYLFKFKDEEAEQHYKENMRWGSRIRNGRKIWEVMDHLLEDLENFGMLGYESRHVRFLEVKEGISENAYFPLPPPLPVVLDIGMTREEAIASYQFPTESDDDDL
ncbi:hypothetical protein N7509_001442 [Penicillium cosmopolitanum]|uniref:Uncharacterized protein n=1 Tax=Penicillium cosmopolitanum TaxID=1131564 RepID=A0A9W9W739_9EURO|nr:uncharacterized protein N7509_001442 [Penicillium cosmopolitanum]KAJ5407559.1 hypothetical protein N7509_001442 [Penicillium cosmopolitanum]